MNIIDLDVLRPEKKVVKIGGHEIDVSFIPCGITFEIDAIMREINKLNREDVGDGGESARNAFNLSVKLCSAFCAWAYPELDEEWFMANASPQQLGVLASTIQETLIKAYAGIETPQKAVKGQKKTL
jgi:hypothetical protein